MIVDDQRYARLGLALMIRKAPDLHVVAEAGYGQEALEVLEQLNRSMELPERCTHGCANAGHGRDQRDPGDGAAVPDGEGPGADHLRRG